MPVKVLIPWRYRATLFTAVTLSWASGTLYFYLNRWSQVEGDFGLEAYYWCVPLLKLHGASAFFMILCFGFLLGTHIPSAWKLKRLKGSGLSLVLSLLLLITTGYGLYYAADMRAGLAWLHAGVGVAFPFLIAFHIGIGRYQKKRY